MFPSPQGGSETTAPANNPASYKTVSIPSRRVGDEAKLRETQPYKSSFHPLKAGRRLANLSPMLTKFDKVSIPSRRVGDLTIEVL